VAERLRSHFPEGLIEDKGSPRLDLMEANRRILIAAGLNKWQIYGGGPCTCCCAEDFYSFRRQGNQAGRMISYIGLR
jgi:polyphenol oxidase